MKEDVVFWIFVVVMLTCLMFISKFPRTIMYPYVQGIAGGIILLCYAGVLTCLKTDLR